MDMGFRFTLHSVCTCDEKDERLSLINEEVKYKEDMDNAYLYFPNKEIQLRVEKCSVSEFRNKLSFDGETETYFFSIASVDAIYTIACQMVW